MKTLGIRHRLADNLRRHTVPRPGSSGICDSLLWPSLTAVPRATVVLRLFRNDSNPVAGTEIEDEAAVRMASS